VYCLESLRYGVITLTMRALAILVTPFLIATAANGEQFSVKCPYQGYYHVTIDVDSGKVVFESAAGSALKGRVDKTVGGEIHFRLFKAGERDFEVVLSPNRDSILWVGIPGDKNRSGQTGKCDKTELRPILSKYDLIYPY
jgi:hypothetical protein